MKKIFTALIFTLLCLLTLSSCKSNDASSFTDSDIETQELTESTASTSSSISAKCKHTYSEWSVTKNATCNENGSSIRTCSKCSKTEKKTIPKNDDHIAVTDKGMLPTCTSKGLTEGSHCSVCDKVLLAQNDIPKEKHDYTDGFCKVCNDKEPSSGLAFITTNDTVLVAGIGTCTDKEIIIPEFDPTGAPVFGIYRSAFKNCTDIVSVVMKENIQALYMDIFMGCTSLERVELPSNLSSLSINMFKDCTSLKEIVIPNRISEISRSCFENCTSLEKVVIPPSVTYFSTDAFNGCKIKDLYISDLNVWLDVTFKSFTANPLYYSENFYVNDTLITKLEINKNTTFGAFAGYEKLTEVTFGNNVTEISKSAFCECINLTNVTFGSKLNKISEYAFSNCGNLQNITFPSSLKTISHKAFQNCTSLQSVILENGFENLGERAFSGCSKLKSIDLPSSVTYIGKAPLEKCASLESITIPFVGVDTRAGGNAPFGALFGTAEYEGGETVIQVQGSIGGTQQEIVYSYCIPISLKHVTVLSRDVSSSNSEFVNCKYIQSITYGKNVTRVSTSSIRGCTSLTDIYYEGTIAEWEKLFYSQYFLDIEGLTVTCSDGIVAKK